MNAQQELTEGDFDIIGAMKYDIPNSACILDDTKGDLVDYKAISPEIYEIGDLSPALYNRVPAQLIYRKYSANQTDFDANFDNYCKLNEIDLELKEGVSREGIEKRIRILSGAEFMDNRFVKIVSYLSGLDENILIDEFVRLFNIIFSKSEEECISKSELNDELDIREKLSGFYQYLSTQARVPVETVESENEGGKKEKKGTVNKENDENENKEPETPKNAEIEGLKKQWFSLLRNSNETKKSEFIKLTITLIKDFLGTVVKDAELKEADYEIKGTLEISNYGEIGDLIFKIFRDLLQLSTENTESIETDKKFNTYSFLIFKTVCVSTDEQADIATYNLYSYMYEGLTDLLVSLDPNLGDGCPGLTRAINEFRNCSAYIENHNDLQYHLTWYLIYQTIAFKVVRLKINRYDLFKVINMMFIEDTSGDSQKKRIDFIDHAVRDLFLYVNKISPTVVLSVNPAQRAYYYRAGNLFKLKKDFESQNNPEITLTLDQLKFFTGIEKAQLEKMLKYDSENNRYDFENKKPVFKTYLNLLNNKPRLRLDFISILKQSIRAIFISNLYRKSTRPVFYCNLNTNTPITNDDAITVVNGYLTTIISKLCFLKTIIVKNYEPNNTAYDKWFSRQGEILILAAQRYVDVQLSHLPYRNLEKGIINLFRRSRNVTNNTNFASIQSNILTIRKVFSDKELTEAEKKHAKDERERQLTESRLTVDSLNLNQEETRDFERKLALYNRLIESEFTRREFYVDFEDILKKIRENLLFDVEDDEDVATASPEINESLKFDEFKVIFYKICTGLMDTNTEVNPNNFDDFYKRYFTNYQAIISFIPAIIDNINQPSVDYLHFNNFIRLPQLIYQLADKIKGFSDDYTIWNNNRKIKVEGIKKNLKITDSPDTIDQDFINSLEGDNSNNNIYANIDEFLNVDNPALGSNPTAPNPNLSSQNPNNNNNNNNYGKIENAITDNYLLTNLTNSINVIKYKIVTFNDSAQSPYYRILKRVSGEKEIINELKSLQKTLIRIYYAIPPEDVNLQVIANELTGKCTKINDAVLKLEKLQYYRKSALSFADPPDSRLQNQLKIIYSEIIDLDEFFNGSTTKNLPYVPVEFFKGFPVSVKYLIYLFENSSKTLYFCALYYLINEFKLKFNPGSEFQAQNIPDYLEIMKYIDETKKAEYQIAIAKFKLFDDTPQGILKKVNGKTEKDYVFLKDIEELKACIKDNTKNTQIPLFDDLSLKLNSVTLNNEKGYNLSCDKNKQKLLDCIVQFTTLGKTIEKMVRYIYLSGENAVNEDEFTNRHKLFEYFSSDLTNGEIQRNYNKFNEYKDFISGSDETGLQFLEFYKQGKGNSFYTRDNLRFVKSLKKAYLIFSGLEKIDFNKKSTRLTAKKLDILSRFLSRVKCTFANDPAGSNSNKTVKFELKSTHFVKPAKTTESDIQALPTSGNLNDLIDYFKNANIATARDLSRKPLVIGSDDVDLAKLLLIKKDELDPDELTRQKELKEVSKNFLKSFQDANKLFNPEKALESIKKEIREDKEIDTCIKEAVEVLDNEVVIADFFNNFNGLEGTRSFKDFDLAKYDITGVDLDNLKKIFVSTLTTSYICNLSIDPIEKIFPGGNPADNRLKKSFLSFIKNVNQNNSEEKSKEFKDKLANIRNDLSELENENDNLRNKLSNTQDKQQKLMDQLKEIKNKQKKNSEELMEISNGQNSINEELMEISKGQNSINKELKIISNGQNSINEELMKLITRLNEINNTQEGEGTEFEEGTELKKINIVVSTPSTDIKKITKEQAQINQYIKSIKKNQTKINKKLTKIKNELSEIEKEQETVRIHLYRFILSISTTELKQQNMESGAQTGLKLLIDLENKLPGLISPDYRKTLERLTDLKNDLTDRENDEMREEIGSNSDSSDDIQRLDHADYDDVFKQINQLFKTIDFSSATYYDLGFQKYFYGKVYRNYPFYEYFNTGKENVSVLKRVEYTVINDKNNETKQCIYLFNLVNPKTGVFVISANEISESHPEYDNLSRILELCKDGFYIMGNNYAANFALYLFWFLQHVEKMDPLIPKDSKNENLFEKSIVEFESKINSDFYFNNLKLISREVTRDLLEDVESKENQKELNRITENLETANDIPVFNFWLNHYIFAKNAVKLATILKNSVVFKSIEFKPNLFDSSSVNSNIVNKSLNIKNYSIKEILTSLKKNKYISPTNNMRDNGTTPISEKDLINCLNRLLYNNPYIDFKRGVSGGENFITYATGPRINIDHVGNVWGHFPFRLFTYTPTIEPVPISVVGVDRGLKDPATVCKIENNDRKNPYIPDQSDFTRQKQLKACNCNDNINKANFKGQDALGKLHLRILKYQNLVNTKSRKQRWSSRALSRERRSISANVNGSYERYYKSIFSKRLTTRFSVRQAHGKYKNSISRLSRNAVHTVTKGVLEFAQEPTTKEKEGNADKLRENEDLIDPRYVKVNIEDLSRYRPKSGESVAGLKSNWTRGLFQSLIQEKAIRDGIYVQTTSAAYSTIRHFKTPKTGEKGYIIVKVNDNDYCVIDGFNKLIESDDVKDEVNVDILKEYFDEKKNKRSNKNKKSNKEKPKVIDYFWQRRISQNRLKDMFSDAISDAQYKITDHIVFYKDNRGNMLRFSLKSDDVDKIEFIGRDLNAPVNIALYSRCLHYLYSLQINVNRIDKIISTDCTSHPMIGKYRDRLKYYLEKFIGLIADSAVSCKWRTRNNFIDGLNSSKENGIKPDLLTKCLIYSIPKPMTKRGMPLRIFYDNFLPRIGVPGSLSIRVISLSNKSLSKVIELFKDTIEDIRNIGERELGQARDSILKNILKIIDDEISKRAENVNFNLSAQYVENSFLIHVLSDRSLSEEELNFDFDSAD